MKKEKYTTIEKAGAVALLLVLWQAVAMAVGEKLLLASPADVLVRLSVIIREPDFRSAVGFSFVRITEGFFLALALGCALAVLSGRFRIIEVALSPFFAAVKSVPVASFIVLALIWFDSENLSVIISLLICLPVVYQNVLTGIRNIDPKMNQMADLYHVKWGKRLIYIWMPQVRPYLISACRTAIGFSWKSGVAAEVIGMPSGSLGEKIYQAKIYFDTAELFAWTIVIVLVSILFEKVFGWLLQKLFEKGELL